jgi:putative acetyltransferase
MSDLIIRSVSDSDAQGLIALIDTVFSEYPGCVLDVDADMPELRNPYSSTRATDGRWWVAELDGAIVGSVAISPEGAGEAELKRLYVSSAARRRGLGGHLVRLVESEAEHRKTSRIVLWTDTRFEDAHRLYERMGYIRSPGTRELHDGSNTIEYHYAKALPR